MDRVAILGIVGLLILIFLISGCPQQGEMYVCEGGEVVSDVSLCPENQGQDNDQQPGSQEKISLKFKGIAYDCLSKKKEHKGGGFYYEETIVEGLKYSEELGAITDIIFELGSEIPDKWQYDTTKWKIEAKSISKNGETYYLNSGTFDTQSIAESSDCENCYSLYSTSSVLISIPYQEEGQYYVKITTPGGESSEKTINMPNPEYCRVTNLSAGDLLEIMRSEAEKNGLTINEEYSRLEGDDEDCSIFTYFVPYRDEVGNCKTYKLGVEVPLASTGFFLYYLDSPIGMDIEEIALHLNLSSYSTAQLIDSQNGYYIQKRSIHDSYVGEPTFLVLCDHKAVIDLLVPGSDYTEKVKAIAEMLVSACKEE